MEDDENACVRNIVKEIMRESIPKKIKVNKNFVTYLTKLLLIDPNWGIGDDFFSQRQNVQRFVKYVIDELLSHEEEPKMVTLKAQFYFKCNLENMQYAIELMRIDLRNRLVLIKDEIYACKPQTKEQFDALQRKIVYYITLRSGLGNPTKPKVYEEALVALKSILDENELREFVTKPKGEKHDQLEQLYRVVAGIRLFNKDCDKGGEGIANLPHLVKAAMEVIRNGTRQTGSMIMDRVNLLSTCVDDCYVVFVSYRSHKLKYQPPEQLQKFGFDIENAKDVLIFYRQYELLIRNVLEELDRIDTRSASIAKSMEKLLKVIHDTVYMKIAIPVGVVFPLFEQLWHIWQQYQDQALLLSRIGVIMSNLETYAKQIHCDLLVIDNTLLFTDADKTTSTPFPCLVSPHREMEIIRPHDVKLLNNISLEYLGFCCWKLIETEGALIPGNLQMGIVVYKKLNYVFSCIEGFDDFAKDPNMYIKGVLDLARKKPQLINLFNLKADLEEVSHIERLVQPRVQVKMCEDGTTQTVLHAEDFGIDPTYKWNIWEMKREALTMASISTAITTSSQTDKTSSNNSIRSQTYYTREMEVQTSRETYTSVPKPSVFMYGLRDRNKDQQFKIDLTRPIEEK